MQAHFRKWASGQQESDTNNMLNAILSRWARARAALSMTFTTFGLTTQRMSTQMPWKSSRQRPAGNSRPPGSLEFNFPAACEAFESSLQDLQGERVEELRLRIDRSREMRDLWYLRTALYNEVARQISQQEAEQRLALLQFHFMPPNRRH